MTIELGFGTSASVVSHLPALRDRCIGKFGDRIRQTLCVAGTGDEPALPTAYRSGALTVEHPYDRNAGRHVCLNFRRYRGREHRVGPECDEKSIGVSEKLRHPLYRVTAEHQHVRRESSKLDLAGNPLQLAAIADNEKADVGAILQQLGRAQNRFEILGFADVAGEEYGKRIL